MASSSYITASRSTSPTYRHSRVADAVQVAPYLTHVVRHHGQVTLIPPENSGRIRKPKKKRPTVRGEYSSSSFDLPRVSAPRSRSHTPRPGSSISVRGLQSDANGIARDTDVEARGYWSHEDFCIPNFPPPSFEEAISATPSPRNSTLGSIIDTRSSVEPTFSSEQDIVREQVSSPTISASQEVVPPSPDDEGPCSASSRSSLDVALERDGHSQWEDDREAGFSLEERVRRELERRQLADSLPRAPHMHELEPNDLSTTEEEAGAEAGPSFRKVEEAIPVTREDSSIGLTHKSASGEAEPIPDLRECDQAGLASDPTPSSSSRNVMAADLRTEGSRSNEDVPHLPSGKGKEKESYSDEPSPSNSSCYFPGRASQEGTLSKIREALNIPLRHQPEIPHISINSLSTPLPPLSHSSEQRPSIDQPPESSCYSHNPSTSHTVSSNSGNPTCTHTLTDTASRPASIRSEASSLIPPISYFSSTTTLLSSSVTSAPTSHSSRPLPTPPSPSPSTSTTISSLSTRRIPPFPSSLGLSVRDRISAFESLKTRPVPPPPPLRPVIRRPPPPVPGPSNTIGVQHLFGPGGEGRVSASSGAATVKRPGDNSSPLPVPRRRPPPLPPHRRQGLDNAFSDKFESTSAREMQDTFLTAPEPSSLSSCPVANNATALATHESTDVHAESVTFDARNTVGAFQHNNVEDNISLEVSPAETSTIPPSRTESDDTLDEAASNSLNLGPDHITVEETPRVVAETEGSQPSFVSMLRDHLSSDASEVRTSDDIPLTHQDLSSSDSILENTSDTSGEHSEDRGGAGFEAASREDQTPHQAEDASGAMQFMPPLRPMLTGPTDLDLLLARLDDPDFTFSGQSYDDLLLLEEIMGPALGASVQLRVRFEDIPLGRVEVLRRRVTKDGRTKLKLALLGILVDKCGICLVQFKEGVFACLLPCRHAFHDNCLRLWIRRGETCPMCRGPLYSS